jgi:molybdate-binding protein
VAAAIASGQADAGFGLEAGARRFGLEFIPVLSERYFLICRKESLQAAGVKDIRDILQGSEYRAEAGKLSGIDVTHAGATLTVDEAFTELKPGRRASQRSAVL